MAQAQRVSINKIRASVGLGISWISPLGPLRLAYALPVVYEKGDLAQQIPEDRIQRLQFQIGTTF